VLANHPLRASDGSIYWLEDGDNGVMKSTDQGQNWMQAVGGGQVRTVPVIELPDHRLAAVGFQTVVLSTDGGMTWKPISTDPLDAFPYQPAELVYSAFRRAFFISHWDCTNNVPTDAIEEYGWDYTMH
jgi:hypothetical protein